MRELLDNPRVAEIYCLNSRDKGRKRMRSASRDLGLSHSVNNKRLFFTPINLSKPLLGLSSAYLATLPRNMNVIIHDAWRVDFGWSLE